MVSLTANVDFEVYSFIQQEASRGKEKNVSRVVNFLLKQAMKEGKKEVEQQIFTKITCDKCGAVYSSKLNQCPGCIANDEKNREIEQKKITETLEKDTAEKRAKLQSLKSDLEIAEQDIIIARNESMKVKQEAWFSSPERKRQADAQEKYDRILRHIVDLNKEIQEPETNVIENEQ